MPTRRRHVVLLVAAMFALFPDIASAQNMEGLRVAPGSRLRVVSTIDADAITGQLTGIGDGTLTIATRRGSRTIPSSSIERIDRSRGEHLLSHTVTGALVGLLAGATVGYAIGNARDNRERSGPPGYDGYGFRVATASGLIVGALGGFVGGAIIGNMTGRERWETVFSGTMGSERAR